MREEITTALGLVTAFNRQESPPGALLQAQDVCIDRPNLIEPRPGFQWSAATVSLGTEALNVVGYGGHLLSLLTSGACVDETAGASIGSFTAPPDPTQRGYSTAQARGSLYCTGVAGMQKAATVAGPWGSSGIRRALGGILTLNTTTTPKWLAIAEGVAYRVVLRRTDANGYIRRSAPSPRILMYNDGATASVDVSLDIQDDAVAGDVLEIYRSQVVADGRIAQPSDQLYLLQEHTLTSAEIVATVYSFTDVVGDDAITGGAELYTNASQQGILQQKDRPPLATDVAPYNRMMFYGDTITAWRKVIKMWTNTPPTGAANYTAAALVYDLPKALSENAAPATKLGFGFDMGAITTTGGSAVVGTPSDWRGLEGCLLVDGANHPGFSGVLQAYSRIVSATATTVTLNQTALSSAGATHSRVYVTLSVGGVDVYITERDNVATREVAYNYTNTMCQKLAHLINVAQSNVSCWYIPGEIGPLINQFQTTGESQPTLFFEYKSLSQASTPTISYNDGWPWLAGLAGATPNPTMTQPQFFAAPLDFDHDAQPGTMWISQVDEPEAVPPVNFVQVGNTTKRIRRMVPTRSALWLFKDDGLFRASGYSPEAISVDIVDPTVRILRSDAACASADVVYAWTSKGVVAVSDAGVRVISEPIRDILVEIEQDLASYPASAGGIWMEYDQVERRVLLGVPNATNQTASSYVMCWSERTQAWTQWVLTPSCAVWDPGTGRMTFSTIRHPASVTTRYTDRALQRSATFPFGDDQQGTATVLTLTDNGDGTWNLLFNNDIVPILAAGDALASGASTTARILSVLSAKLYVVDTGDVLAGTKPEILRAATSVIEWNLKPQPTPFDLKVYRDSRIVWNQMELMAKYTMTYQSGTQVDGGYIAPPKTVTVPVETAASDYLRLVGVPIDAALAGTFRAYATIRQGGANWLIGGFAVSFEMGGEALSP